MTIDPARLLELHARAILLDLGAIDTVTAATVCHDGTTIVIQVGPTPNAATARESLDPCARAVLAIIEEANQRLPTEELIAKLAGKYEAQSVRNSLWELSNLGLIKSPGRGKRDGYAPIRSDPADGLTPSQRDALDVLRAAMPARLSVDDVTNTLAEAGKEYERQTVANALTALARLGLAESPGRGRHEGYGAV